QVETIYNVAKVAEGLWKYKYPNVADGAKNAENAAKARQLGISKQLQSNRSVIERCGQQVQKGSRHSKNLFKQLQQADSQRQLARAKTLDKFLTREAALSSEAKTQLASLTSNGTRLGQRMVDGIGVGPEAKSAVEGIISWPTEASDGNTSPAVDTKPNNISTQNNGGGEQDKPSEPAPDSVAQSADSSTHNTARKKRGKPTGQVPDGDTSPDDTSDQDVTEDESDAPSEQTTDGDTDSDDTSGQDTTGDESNNPSDLISALKNTDTQGSDPTGETTLPPDPPFPATTDNISSGWAPTAPHITEAERESAAIVNAELAQLNADLQRLRSAYQGSQTENQQQSAASMAQIERERSTQIGDAILGGFTSGVAQGIGTLGERIGQGAGRRIAQDTGLIDRHPKPSTPGQSGGSGAEGGQGPITGDCPAGTTYDPVSQACIRQDNTSKSYQGSWRASSTCAANYGSRGSGTCSWNGSAQITLHPGGRVSGSISGGSRFTFNEGGNFSGCGGGSASHSISGSHTNGSFSATASNGARITGRYTDAAISGSTSGAGTNALSGGRSMSCRTSGSINLSR
ncbi:MAG: hypothetical protein RBS34_15855, partial [Desulfofustis sp.]|nr:hypothetical protein [Desulfofustis sp.]